MIKKSLLLAFVIIFLLNISAKAEERIFTDEMGRQVKIPYPAKRIVSLAPSITEILFALGLDEQVAAITNFCDYPEAVLKKPRIGGFVNPDIEKIVSLKPDLIIGIRDGNRMDTVDRLNDFGLPAYLIDPKGFDGVMQTIKNIGDVVGREKESRKMVKEMVKKTENIITLTQSLSRPKVFFQLGDAPMVTVGKGTLANDLIRLAGGRSISENEPTSYPVYSIETVLLKAPEIIIMTSMDSKKNTPQLIKKWESWKSIPAVRMSMIYVIDSNLVDRPTPRIVEGLEALVRIIHPEVFMGKSLQHGKN
ncbi:MAG TPA: cobalamin-binding protein [Thermodesulfobacteriota bacterium]|nr:cobalamin-binding protein [Thermodesulfobacteriota bacterium]